MKKFAALTLAWWFFTFGSGATDTIGPFRDPQICEKFRLEAYARRYTSSSCWEGP